MLVVLLGSEEAEKEKLPSRRLHNVLSKHEQINKCTGVEWGVYGSQLQVEEWD